MGRLPFKRHGRPWDLGHRVTDTIGTVTDTIDTVCPPPTSCGNSIPFALMALVRRMEQSPDGLGLKVAEQKYQTFQRQAPQNDCQPPLTAFAERLMTAFATESMGPWAFHVHLNPENMCGGVWQQQHQHQHQRDHRHGTAHSLHTLAAPRSGA